MLTTPWCSCIRPRESGEVDELRTNRYPSHSRLFYRFNRGVKKMDANGAIRSSSLLSPLLPFSLPAQSNDEYAAASRLRTHQVLVGLKELDDALAHRRFPGGRPAADTDKKRCPEVIAVLRGLLTASRCDIAHEPIYRVVEPRRGEFRVAVHVSGFGDRRPRLILARSADGVGASDGPEGERRGAAGGPHSPRSDI